MKEYKDLKRFSFKSYLKIGGRADFVDVEVVPEERFIQEKKITNREEYEAIVQYSLQRDNRLIEAVTHGNLPTNFIFGPVEPEEGAPVYDLFL